MTIEKWLGPLFGILKELRWIAATPFSEISRSREIYQGMVVKRVRYSVRSHQEKRSLRGFKILGLTILMSLVFTTIQARQTSIQEDFEDQDLTQNPAWSGHLEDFQVIPENENHLLQLNSEEAGHSILFTESESVHGSWEFFYRPQVSPSNNNRTFFILISDSDDFNFIGGGSTSSMNGYALRAGDNTGHRAFKLGKVENGNFQSSIITETETTIEEGVGYRVRVERSPEGDWQIFVGEGYGSTPVADSPVVNDDTFDFSAYFGLLVIYSSANRDKFFFDDILVQGTSDDSGGDGSEGDGSDGSDGSGDSGSDGDDSEGDDSEGDGSGDSDGSDDSGSDGDGSEGDDSEGDGSDDSDGSGDSGSDGDDSEGDDSDDSEGDDSDDSDDSGDSGSDGDDSEGDDSGGDGSDDSDDSGDSGSEGDDSDDSEGDGSDDSDGDDSDGDDSEGDDSDGDGSDDSDDSGDSGSEGDDSEGDGSGDSDDSGDSGSDGDDSEGDDSEGDDSDDSEGDGSDDSDGDDSEGDDSEGDGSDGDGSGDSDDSDDSDTEDPEEEPENLNVQEIRVIRADQIQITFDLPIEESTVQPSHFNVDRDVGQPVSAEPVSGQKVDLHFARPFPEGVYQLSISGVESESGGTVPAGSNTPFEVVNPFLMISAHQVGSRGVEMEFSHNVDIGSFTAADIHISGIGHPAEMELTDPKRLRIQFEEIFKAGEFILTAGGIASEDGWQLQPETALAITLYDSFEPGDLLISEFYYRVPVSWRTETYDRPQYVELYNRSGKRLNLRDVKLSGQNISIGRDLLIDPGEFLVITRGKPVFTDRFGERNFVEADQFPRLNLTTTDRIHLEANDGATIEELTYVSSEWGGNSVSLERLSYDLGAEHRGNWAESADALSGSPGLPNTASIPSGPPEALTLETPEPRLIRLLFSRELTPESVSDLSRFSLSPDSDIESASLDSRGHQLLIRTTMPLENGRPYLFRYTGIEDLFGNRIGEQKEMEFTFLNPFYVEQVRLTGPKSVRIHFSIPIQFDSIELSQFSLRDGTAPVQYEIVNSTTIDLLFSEVFGFGHHTLTSREIESFDPDIDEQWMLEPEIWVPFYRFEEKQPGDIVLNEFMIRPPAGMPGYVEVFNRSARFLNLKDFELRRRSGVSNSGGVISGVDLPIEPNGFRVITTDLLQMKEHFGEGPWAEMKGYPGFTQTASDRIRLLSPAGEVIEEVEYHPPDWGGNGVSLERKSVEAPVHHIFNWGASTDDRKGTPGLHNSVGPDVSPPYPEEVRVISEESISVTFAGSVDLDGADVSGFQISGGIGVELLEIINVHQVRLKLAAKLSSGEPYTLNIHNITDIFGNEMEPFRTTVIYYKVEPAERGDVVIHEFMYNEPDDYSRYIELYNRSQKVIDLDGWQQANNTGTARTLVSGTTLLHPESYLVIAPNEDLLQIFPGIRLLNAGTSLSALKNGGDSIIIFSESGTVIDSLDYHPEWGGKGVALERLSSEAPTELAENWAESTDPLLGTPGKPNSVEPDPNPPVVLSVRQSANAEFEIVFDKRPDHSSGSDPANFTFQPHVNIAAVIPGGNTIMVRVQSEMENGRTYELTVANIRDIFGHEMEAVTYSVRYLILSEVSVNDIVINEILYRRAHSGSPQFIELYNRTGKNFDLSGWSLENRSGAMRLPPGVFIPAESYRVIADSYFPEPGEAILLSGFRPFSSSGDEVIIKNRSGETIDSLSYRSDWSENLPGVSLERKDPDALSVDPHNWDASRSEAGSTPGEQNSRFEPDEAPPAVVFVNFFHPDSIEVVFDKFVRIAEDGFDEPEKRGRPDLRSEKRGSPDLRPANSEDGVPQPRFLINGTERSLLKSDPLEGNRIVLDGSGIEKGTRVTLEIEHLGDYQGNVLNRWDGWIAMPAEPGDLLFNEIMYHPLADNRDGLSDQSEYLEIVNIRPYPVSLEGMVLHDEPDENGKVVKLEPGSTRHSVIAPGGFLVIYPESSAGRFPESRTARFFGLNGDETEVTTLRIDRNTLNLTLAGRAVYLADSTLRAIDRVHYSPDWHNPNLADTRGIALERISTALETDTPDNWSSSAHLLGGTPGRENSIFQIPGSQNGNIGISVHPNPFSPDGDGFDDHLFIQYRLDQPDYLIRIRIFDRYGRLVRNLVNGEAAGFEGTRIWDGRMDNGQNNRIGIYIILFNAFDSANGRNLQFRETAVIARRF